MIQNYTCWSAWCKNKTTVIDFPYLSALGNIYTNGFLVCTTSFLLKRVHANSRMVVKMFTKIFARLLIL